ncbi:MAG: peptidoglycan -binding protein [Xanthobacteraceae bacterium]|jgi:chemotaxis protein MotB
MALARNRHDRAIDYWPGFVDALSTLVLGIIFMLTVFVVVQFFLAQQITSNKDTVLAPLQAKLEQLNELLSLEKGSESSLQEQIAQLRSSLAMTEGERDRYKDLFEGLSSGAAINQGKVTELGDQLAAEKRMYVRAAAQIEVLTQQIVALRKQLASVQTLLDDSEKRNKESQVRLADLGLKLNVALMQRVEELSRYRSDFFGRLRVVLGNRPDIRIEGDRFVFQSELFFDSGEAVLRADGTDKLDKVATALIEVEKQIPREIPWILRVDGHTDVRPMSGAFKSNWDLSAARAISVVQYLIGKGIAPERLVAAGFGEFQPLERDKTEEAYSRNRRIELKLTER